MMMKTTMMLKKKKTVVPASNDKKAKVISFAPVCALHQIKCASQYEACRGVIRRVVFAKKVAKRPGSPPWKLDAHPPR